MKKANIKAYNQFYKGFVLIEDMIDLINFRHEVTYGKTKESASTLVERAQDRAKGKDVGHATDAITHAVEKVHEHQPKGIVYLQAEIMGEYANHLDKYIHRGEKIAINPFNLVSYFTIPKDAEIEILEERTKYTLDDIKVKRWEGGAHWYAKVGNMDVVIDGEQKWGAKWKAQEMAERFLKEYNNEQE